MEEYYYKTLLNAVSEAKVLETIKTIKGTIQKIGKNEVEWKIKRTKKNKASELPEVCIEMFKELGELGVDWM